MSKNLIIVGAGKFGREVYSWSLKSKYYGWEKIIGFLDNRINILDNYNYKCSPILGSAETYIPKENDVFVCAIGEPKIKKNICEILINKEAKFTNVIHDTVIIGKNVDIGVGNIICPYVVMSCDIKIKNHVAINFHTAIAHDVIIENYCQINGNCTINGNATIKEGVQIGSNACMLPNSIAEEYSTIGAGTVVMKVAQAHRTIFGVPGKIIT